MTIPRERRSDAPRERPTTSEAGWTSFSPPTRPRVAIGFASLSERRLVLDWLSEGLRPGQPARLIREYPLLFDRNASAFHCTVWEGVQPVAFCSLWAVHFRVGVQRLRAGMISLVYTDPSKRGRGYAKVVLEAAIERAESLELGLLMLWSDLDGLYQPLGFHRAGRESLLLLDPARIDAALGQFPDAPALAVSPAEVADWPEIERLRGFRSCQLELGPGELSRARTTPDLHVRVARDETGLRGFAMCGRGDDFASVIHEWGGAPEASLACCRALMNDVGTNDEMMLMSPPSREEMPWALRRHGARVVHQPLAWLRIASAGALATDLSRFLGPDTPLSLELSGDGADRRVRVGSRRGERELSEPAFLQSVFGSTTAASECPTNFASLEEEPDALSVPLFVWGLESI